MSGTIAGSRKAQETLKKRLGGKKALRKWRQYIGAIGGRLGKTGGFASNKIGDDGLTGRERARIAGAIGGRKSKRKAKK